MGQTIFDNGRSFDWGKSSKDYSIFRDIYPESFYDKIKCFGVGLPGQMILDLGTGTGVLPRGLASSGAKFIGTDISAGQIEEAKNLAVKQELDMEWKVCSAEETGLPDQHFDAITACQCWWYFNMEKMIPEVLRMLKPDGKLLLAFMSWLPQEDKVAAKTEELVLKYNPDWTGANFKRHKLSQPEWSKEKFDVVTMHTYDEYVRFTRETWRGRIRACRGIGASLPEDEVKRFDQEHEKLLESIADDSLDILHQIWFYVFTPKR